MSMTDIWIVLTEDRHADTDALPFSSEERAVAHARAKAEENAGHHDAVEWNTALTPGMTRDGWVLYLPYGPEGDSIRVIRRTVDGKP